MQLEINRKESIETYLPICQFEDLVFAVYNNTQKFHQYEEF